MRIIILLITISSFIHVQGQHNLDFEFFKIEKDSFLNGSSLSGKFGDEVITLPNNYNTQWNSWTGFSISNKTDSLTRGVQNQYSSITGSGADNSAQYAIGFASPTTKIFLKENFRGSTIFSLSISNNTYTYYSLKEGDSFAKKFGGISGDDPDYYGLVIYGYFKGQKSKDSIEVTLADYRFDNNDKDYIHKKWQKIEMKILGPVDSLEIKAISTDVGMFGINTPTYFCIDNIRTSAMITSNIDVNVNSLKVYPNPVSNILHIEKAEIQNLRIYNEIGKLILHQTGNQQSINISELSSGNYYLYLKDQNGELYLSPFMKL